MSEVERTISFHFEGGGWWVSLGDKRAGPFSTLDDYDQADLSEQLGVTPKQLLRAELRLARGVYRIVGARVEQLIYEAVRRHPIVGRRKVEGGWSEIGWNEWIRQRIIEKLIGLGEEEFKPLLWREIRRAREAAVKQHALERRRR
ncbi:MAG: hypothetical protein ACE5PT_12295, partial [Gemmatimonadales bacterium]